MIAIMTGLYCRSSPADNTELWSAEQLAASTTEHTAEHTSRTSNTGGYGRHVPTHSGL